MWEISWLADDLLDSQEGLRSIELVSLISQSVIGQFQAPADLLQWKPHWYPLNKRMGGLQRRSRGFVEEKNWKQDCPSHGLFTTQTVIMAATFYRLGVFVKMEIKLSTRTIFELFSPCILIKLAVL